MGGEMVKQIFSDYVRALEPSGEPSDERLDELWTELRRVLRRALQRRGLWDRPPSYLGVTGASAWTTPETANRRGVPVRAQDALDELTTDFYVETFVERLAVLRRYLYRGDSIEKVVHLRVRQFLHQRQRQSDPLGHRLFQWLRDALQSAVDRGSLHLVGSGSGRRGKVNNDTVFGFDPASEAEPATEVALATEVGYWNDSLLVGWVTARGAGGADLTARLETHVLELRDAGIEVFVFKTLVDVFKSDVRNRLAALGDPVEATDHSKALDRLEQRDRILELSECVEAAVRGGGGQQRTRDQLIRLWRFLEVFALAAIESERQAGASATLTATLQDETRPSNRELGRLLDIRHDRFPTLFARLKEEVQRCLAAPSGAAQGFPGASGEGPTPDTLGGAAARDGSEARVDENRDLRQQLKRMTAEAYRRESLAPRAAEGRAPGDLYHLEACPEPGIEWLVVETEAETGNCLVIPADSLAWIGSADLAVDDETAAGPLILRADLGVWLGPEILAADRRTGAVAATDLQLLHSHRSRDPEAAVSISAQEIDSDPDYRDWRRTLEGARNAVARVYGGQIGEISLAQEQVAGALHSEAVEPMEVVEMPVDEEPDSEQQTGKVLRPERWMQRPAARFAIAASGAAVLASSALLGVWLEQRRAGTRISNLEAGLEKVEAERDTLLSEQSRYDALIQDVESRFRAVVAERDSAVEKLRNELIPEAAIPWLLAPLGMTRGDPLRLEVPPGARSIAMLIDASGGDLLEVRDAAGDDVWSSVVQRTDSPDETLVRLPAELMPPGEYLVKVSRGGTVRVEFEIEIESP